MNRISKPTRIARRVDLEHEAPNAQLLLKDRALSSAAEGITIADALAPDRPLIYVNDGFTRLTGYSVEETVGTNCRFLQGEDTDPKTVAEIRDAIGAERACEVELLNYRKDGTPFWNRLSITPVRDDQGRTTHFVGIQSDVTRRREAEERLRLAHRRMQNDLNAAARIQHALLPTKLPQLRQACFGWSYLPCDELAGDILDVFLLDDHRAAFYVLDVSGHGVQAALLSTTLSRWLARAPMELKQDPVAMLEHLNDNFQIDDALTQFFTCCYGVIDLEAAKLSFSLAGHPLPVLIRSGKAESLIADGFPVGVVETPEYELVQVDFEPGDRFYFFSDGAIEQAAADGSQFGKESLMDELLKNQSESLQASIDLSLATVLNRTADGKSDDDISMLGISILGG